MTTGTNESTLRRGTSPRVIATAPSDEASQERVRGDLAEATSSAQDDEVIERQLGRPLRAAVDVVCRCDRGFPVVLRVPPILDEGEPFPTRYWLSCPAARASISQIESQGGVREADARLASDPELADAMEQTHRRYARERDEAIPADATLRPRGGVGGTLVDGARGGVKCLHAHLADYLAVGDNPIGEEAASRILPLFCPRPCGNDLG